MSGRIRSLETHLKIFNAIKAKNENDAVTSMISHLIEIEGGEVGAQDSLEEDEEFPPES